MHSRERGGSRVEEEDQKLHSDLALWGCAELPEVKRKWPMSYLQKCGSWFLSHRTSVEIRRRRWMYELQSFPVRTYWWILHSICCGTTAACSRTERSSQADCFTQLTGQNKGKIGYLFPLIILQDSRAWGVFYNHVCLCCVWY